MTPPGDASNRRLSLSLAAAVFLSLWLRPLYAVHLRRQLRRDQPAVWDQLPSNGRFAFLLPQMAGSRYHDESTYAAPVHQILLHGVPYSPYWAGHKEFSSWTHDFIAQYLVAAPGLLCGGDITLTWLLAESILGALWFLFFYTVFRWWCGRREVAIPLALFSVFFPDLYIWLLDINLHPAVNLSRLTTIFIQDHGIRPNFYRLPAPFLSYLLMSSVFVMAWRLGCRKDFAPRSAVLIGGLFAALAMVHPFEHLFAMATLCFFAAALWAAKAPEAARKNLAVAAVVGAALSGAWLLLMSSLHDPERRRQTLEMLGLQYNHHFFKITIVHLAAAALAWRWQSREREWPRRLCWLLMACAQLGGFACRNSQVVTGLHFVPLHYIILGSFMGTAMLMLKLSEVLSSRRWWTAQAGLWAALLFSFVFLVNEKTAAEQTYRILGQNRDVDAAFRWTREHAGDESVFATLSMMTASSLPIYTQAKVLVPPTGVMPTVLYTNEEYERLVASLLKTVDADPERFLAARWPLKMEQDALFAPEYKRQRLEQLVDERPMDAMEWAGCFPHAGEDDGPLMEARRKIREFSLSAEPAKGPYFVWINARDIPLLKRFPKIPRASLVYSNASVWIFKSDSPR
ncbi:MAG: hypothetical protein HY077_16240 [Elusimicrobia bacterium]|nr:hypothetical protein [Elusimicrobiota bacterium]